MASVSTYLLFNRQTADAFTFYKSVFGTEYISIMRHGDVPSHEGQSDLSEEDKRLIINVQLPTIGGHVLMGSDIPEGMGMELREGNNVQICLQPDSRTDADRLFAALSAGGTVKTPMMEMFWGDYYGELVDRFGIIWLINCSSKV
jgi:PhnB protein